jgi:hypothetical protein
LAERTRAVLNSVLRPGNLTMRKSRKVEKRFSKTSVETLVLAGGLVFIILEQGHLRGPQSLTYTASMWGENRRLSFSPKVAVHDGDQKSSPGEAFSL